MQYTNWYNRTGVLPRSFVFGLLRYPAFGSDTELESTCRRYGQNSLCMYTCFPSWTLCYGHCCQYPRRGYTGPWLRTITIDMFDTLRTSVTAVNFVRGYLFLDTPYDRLQSGVQVIPRYIWYNVAGIAVKETGVRPRVMHNRWHNDDIDTVGEMDTYPKRDRNRC